MLNEGIGKGLPWANEKAHNLHLQPIRNLQWNWWKKISLVAFQVEKYKIRHDGKVGWRTGSHCPGLSLARTCNAAFWLAVADTPWHSPVSRNTPWTQILTSKPEKLGSKSRIQTQRKVSHLYTTLHWLFSLIINPPQWHKGFKWSLNLICAVWGQFEVPWSRQLDPVDLPWDREEERPVPGDQYRQGALQAMVRG